MGTKYGEYLEEGTKRIIEMLSFPDVEEEEKCLIIEAFSNELSNNIGNTGNMKDYELLLYSVSARFIDEKISAVLSNQNASYCDYDNVIKMCQRQQELFSVFQSRKWGMPSIDNTNLNKCLATLHKRQESLSITTKILDKDRKIDDLRRSAQADLSIQECDTVLSLLTELEEDIALCISKRIVIPVINNKDTNKVRKKIIDLKKVAEQKEVLYQSIRDVDLRIYSLVSPQRATPQQWQEVVSLCQRQSDLFSNCIKNRWSLPSVRYDNPNEVANKYKHFLEMIELDRVLSSEWDPMSVNKQYKVFFANCEKQKRNIEVCRRNGWEIPALNVNDPVGLFNAVYTAKSRRDNVNIIKLGLVLTSVIIICLIALVLFGVYKYREGKIQIPFDPSYVVGKDLEAIFDELSKAGFENIIPKPDNSGWQGSGEVISVSIDNSDTYGKGDYRKPDVNVVVTYSSPGRIGVTDIIKDWKEMNYETVKKVFKDAGFTNVTVEEVVTPVKERDKLTAALSLNGKMYTNENCYLPTSAPIIISYYSLKIGIGNDCSQFIGQDYEVVVASLIESGFTNVQTQKITSGWTKGNTVVGVTVNNLDTYNSSESFYPDTKIVVKYSSDDRIDATSVLEDWQTKDYQQVHNSLTSKGFTNITVVEKNTNDSSKNHLVSSITLNNESFTAGDCYLQKATSIKIEYYVLTIVIGDTASSFEGKQYTDVVANLKRMGFTNIQLQRANDIGWWPIHAKEGSIKTFYVDGNRDFADTDSFRYDAQIIIIVHTKKNEGCEDITVIAH